MRARRHTWALVVGLAGCGTFEATLPDGGAALDASDAPDGGGPPDAGFVRRCTPPAGVSGSPQTIEQAVALINALPKPTTLACYLESLDRPLALYPTSGTVSAQPAQGVRSPRIFIFSGPLISSIVPDGAGAHLLEFGQLDGKSSIKGELTFPVTAPLSAEAPYAQVMFSAGATSCSFCHRDEAPDRAVGAMFAYRSRALRPVPEERVPVAYLEAQQRLCDPAAEPERCELLDALLVHGPVVLQHFPADLPTIFE